MTISSIKIIVANIVVNLLRYISFIYIMLRFRLLLFLIILQNIRIDDAQCFVHGADVRQRIAAHAQSNLADQERGDRNS